MGVKRGTELQRLAVHTQVVAGQVASVRAAREGIESVLADPDRPGHVPAPCAALTAKGRPCPITGDWPYRDLLMVCHVHNPNGRYAEQHPGFRKKVIAQLDALIANVDNR